MRLRFRPAQNTYTTVLSRLRPFAACSADELGAIARSCTPIVRKAGSVLARECALRKEVLILLSGSALVTRDGLPETVLDAGDSFGDADVLARGQTSAGLVALTDVELLVMSGAEFSAVFETVAPFRRRIVRALAERARFGKIEASHSRDEREGSRSQS